MNVEDTTDNAHAADTASGRTVTAPTAAAVPRRRFAVRMPPYIGPLTALIVVCVFLTIDKPFFASKDNIFNILTTNSPLMIVAIGMTVAMIGGGFDLSVGSVLAATGISLNLTLSAGIPAWLSLLIALLFGFVVGAVVNGVLIAKAKLNFFVVTLGVMTALSGLVYVVSNGQTSTVDSALITNIGNATPLGVPAPIFVMLGIFLLTWWMLAMTPLGRNIYAIGGSAEAARLSGIRVPLLTILVYGIVGTTAAAAGVVQTGLLSAASPTVGGTIALTAGAAVLLGGTSFNGGVGTVTGTVVGVLLIAVLQNGLGLFGLASFWQNVVTGVVLIIAVGLDQLHRLGRRGLLRRKEPAVKP